MRKQLGLSLVELMISITLGLVLMTGVIQMFLSSKSTFNNQQSLSRIQETGRLAIDFIARDVRMAAYYGCAKNSSGAVTLLNDLTVSGLHENFGVGIMGYDTAANVPHGASTDLSASPIPVTDTSILVVRSASQLGSLINAPSNDNNVFAYTSAAAVDPNNCVGNLCKGGAAVATDCAKSMVFAINSLAVVANKLTINHTDAWAKVVAGESTPITFVAGQVMPMNTTVYFLATRAGSNIPSLWQKINNGTPIELLEGVEKMNVTYATLDTPPKPRVITTGYRKASEIAAADWPNVISVRVDLVVSSLENNVLGKPEPYKFLGKEIANDQRLRQVFSSVITIRSRMPVR